MATTKKRNGPVYTTYHYTGDNPIFDWFDTLKKDSGMTDKEISLTSKVTKSTLKRWDKRSTRSPKLDTLAAAARAAGADMLPLTAEARRTYRPNKK